MPGDPLVDFLPFLPLVLTIDFARGGHYLDGGNAVVLFLLWALFAIPVWWAAWRLSRSLGARLIGDGHAAPAVYSVGMRSILLAAGVAVVLLGGSWALFIPSVIADYSSGAHGYVRDAKGTPVEGAEVSLQFERTVFQAITPVRVASGRTDASGVFNVSRISCGRAGGPFILTVSKSGFVTARRPASGYAEVDVILRPLAP